MIQGTALSGGCETQRQLEVIVALSLDAAMYIAVIYYTLRRRQSATQFSPHEGAAEVMKGND